MNAFLPAYIARRKVMAKPSQLLFQALVSPATMERPALQRLQANAGHSAPDDILAFQRVAGNRTMDLQKPTTGRRTCASCKDP